MGLYGGDAPPPPDPYATAQAQAGVNKDALLTAARLNQITQNNPFGSTNWSGDYGTEDHYDPITGQMVAGTPSTRTQNVTLNPEIQRVLDSQIDITQGLSDKSLGRMNQITNDPFTLAGQPSVRTAGNVPGLRTSLGLKTGYDPAGSQQTSLGDVGALARSFDDVGGPQRGLNNTPVGQQVKQAQDAVYNSQTQYVDDDFNRQQDRLGATLAAKGIPEGSEAWTQAMSDLQRQKQGALTSARNAATTQGFNVQQGLFGQDVTKGQFTNNAQEQAFQQAAKRGEFGNEAQQAAFAQELARGNFANTAQDTQNRQNREGAQFYNDNATQEAQFGNDALARIFGMGLDLQQGDQAYRSQGINENILQRNQGFNELAAFLNGSPIAPQNPTFQPFNQSQAAQAAPDLVGTANNNYTQGMQASAAGAGGLFGSLGKLGSAAIGKWG